MFNANKTGELIVKQRYSPRIKIIVAGVLGLLVVGGAGAIYNYGLTSAGFKRFVASQVQENLQRQIEQYKNDNQQLREALARAERTLQMDQAAYLELDQSLKDSARQIVKLREELNFYRNIISPANKKSGLRIQSLNIEPEGKNNNLYKYKLVLIQALKHEQTIRGNVKFEVMGLQVGESAVLRFPDSKTKPINVSFKYFQDIEGQIELPRNFEPHEIKVNVITKGRGAQTIEQVYAWPKFNGKA